MFLASSLTNFTISFYRPDDKVQSLKCKLSIKIEPPLFDCSIKT